MRPIHRLATEFLGRQAACGSEIEASHLPTLSLACPLGGLLGMLPGGGGGGGPPKPPGGGGGGGGGGMVRDQIMGLSGKQLHIIQRTVRSE